MRLNPLLFPCRAGTSPLLCGDKRRAGAKGIAVGMARVKSKFRRAWTSQSPDRTLAVYKENPRKIF